MGYWEERQTEIEDKAHKKSESLIKELAKLYKTSIAISQDKIEAFITRYATDNQITLIEAEKVLSGIELKDYKARLTKSLAQYKSSNSEVALADIDKLNRQAKITRLQGLVNELEVELGLLAQESDEVITKHLSEVAQEVYIATVSTAEGVSMAVAFQGLNKDAMEFILSHKWSGENYSSRIWSNKTLLVKTLKETLTIGLVQGTSTQQMARDLRDKMDNSFKNASRLVRTESNFVLGQSTMQFYKDNGVEKYQYLAEDDSRLCSKCKKNDRKQFKLEDMKIGVNHHPVHPNCRCTTIPVL